MNAINSTKKNRMRSQIKFIHQICWQ